MTRKAEEVDVVEETIDGAAEPMLTVSLSLMYKDKLVILRWTQMWLSLFRSLTTSLDKLLIVLVEVVVIEVKEGVVVANVVVATISNQKTEVVDVVEVEVDVTIKMVKVNEAVETEVVAAEMAYLLV